MASGCSGGVAGIVCRATQHVQLPGGISVGQISQIAGTAAGKAASSATGDVLSEIAQAMASAANGLLKTLSSFWMNVDTPQLNAAGSPVGVIGKDTSWIVTITAIACILVAAGRMAIHRRGQPAQVMLLGLARLVIASAAATVIVEVAGKLGDTFSADLMSSAHLGAGGWSGIISATAITGAVAGGDGMLLIIALLIIFSALVQLMLMILRLGLLVVLTGTLPLAAAASMSEWGQTWWRKHVAWLAAWLLYKPAAALLYAAAFALTDGKRTATEVISGFMLLILSVLILPALLRVIVPMTASLGAASSGTLAMGTTGALATGAIRVAAIRGGGAAAATAAPSGNSAPAGGGTGGPDGVGLPAPAPGGSHSPSGSSQRAVAQLPATPSAARHDGPGAGSRTWPPEDSAGAAFDAASPGPSQPMPPLSSGPPAPGGGGASGRREATGDREAPAGSDSPTGAGGRGDDTDREIGG